MQFSALFILSLILCNFVTCENKINKLKWKKGVNSLGYLQDFPVDEDLKTVKLTGFLISPVIIVPVRYVRQSVKKMDDNEALEQNISPVSVTIVKYDNEIKTNEISSDIEVNFRQGLDRGNNSNKDLKQVKVNEAPATNNETNIDENTEGITTEIITTLETTTDQGNITQETITVLTSTTEDTVTYPNAPYNNEEINSLSITIKNPDDVLYPPIDNDKWNNFTSTDTSLLKENITKPAPSDSLNLTGYPSVNETDSLIKGVYPAALYNNAEIDQLSITTNSYTNGSPLPPPQDDRWRRFSSLRKMLPTSNEFKPLAGLYYDGFLHRPILKAPWFEPYNRYLL